MASIAAALFAAAALEGMRGSATRAEWQARIRVPSAGSIMEALHEPTHSKDDPVLVASVEEAAEAFTQAGAEAEASMVEAATDSCVR